MYQEVLLYSHLKYLNKAVIYKKYNWQCAGAELAICTACVEGPKALLHALRHVLGAKILLVDFNLAVSTPTAKLPNLIPCQIYRLYSMYHSS